MIRIGNPPRAPRRQRIARRVNRYAGYLLGAGVFLIATAVSMDDGHLLAAGLIVAAMLANPWRPKRPARPVRRATRRAVQSRPWRISPRRSVTPTLRARAA